MSAERPVVQPCLVQLRRVTPEFGRRLLRPARRRVALLALAAASCVAAMGATLPAAALALPDGRAYEQVTPVDKNGIDTGTAIPSTDGNAANWEAIGGCCGATSSAVTLYQSKRTASGWTTNALTPKPPNGGLVGLFAEQAPLWWTGDLTQTIYTTPASYDANDQRPLGPGATNYLDLYEQNANTGALSWLSQGPFPGSGSNPVTSTFDAASADGQHVGFSSPDRLVPEATGLADLNTPPQFVYERNIGAGTTSLINITNSTLSAAANAGDTTISIPDASTFQFANNVTIDTGGAAETLPIASVDTGANTITLNTPLANSHAAGALVEAIVSPDGAILGNGNFLAQSFLAANQFGTTTNSVSNDGTKLFFESPPSFAGGSGSAEGVGPSHLFMRDTSNGGSTTLIDNPVTPTGQAIYEGAAQDGSKVFFTSDEGLGGNPNTDNEVYEFNTATKTVTPISGGSDGTADGNAIGVAAISNDGSHVYFTANADNLDPNATGTANAPNLYVFNTNAPLASATTFIATLDEGDVSSCPLGCGAGARAADLAAEPDISRPAIPTPDGTVLVFDSIANLTGQNPSGPTTTLAADASPGDSTITVADASGLVVARPIILPGAAGSDTDAVQSVSGNTVTLSRPLQFGHSAGDQVVQLAAGELYRYSTANNSLVCISCTPAGVTATGPASFGAAGGGSYAPPGTGVNMSSDGSRIFFDSPDPLVASDVNTGSFSNGLFGGVSLSEDVYEWENGTVSLISDGRSATGSVLGGTTLNGNDVFFTTLSSLVPGDGDGFDDVYDARVGGGFPAPTGPGSGGCQSGDSCHSGAGPTVFFPVPGSSTLIAPATITPQFSVNAISTKQRHAFAKNGKVTITVHTNAPGKITANAYGKLASGLVRMSSASHSLSGAKGGTAKLTLRLNRAGRKALASKHKLPVRIEVSFSQSGEVDVATMTLTSKTQHRTKHKQRVHAKKNHSRLEAWVAR